MQRLNTFIVTAIGLCATYTYSQITDWSHLYDKSGIAVHQNKSQALPEFRAVGILELNFYEVLAVLSDVLRRTEWVEGLVQIKTISEDPKSSLVVYNHFDLSWPAPDRESVINVQVQIDKIVRSAFLLFDSTTELPVPETKDVIRVKTVQGTTHLKYLGANRILISEQILMDPSGSFPNWIAKIFIEDIPIKTLATLKNRWRELVANMRTTFAISKMLSGNRDNSSWS